MKKERSLSFLQSKFEGPKILTGSRFGIEDSILSILFLLITGIVFLLLSRKEGLNYVLKAAPEGTALFWISMLFH
jgi:hypothetical protein